MAKWAIGLAVAIVLTGAKMIAHPAAATPERRAELTAVGLNAMAPRRLGTFSTLTGAKADGRTVEVDLQLAPNAPSIVSQDDFARALVAVSCKEQGVTSLLEQGGSVRYAITTAYGRTLSPITVSNCPAGS